jgi:sulfonate transport system substrate-binding protein
VVAGLSTVVALVLLLAATACGSASASNGAAATSGHAGGVVLKVGDQKAGSRALLVAAGLLDGTPYQIQWSEFTSGPPLLEALNAGAIDIGATGDTPPIFAAAAGSKIVLVGASKSVPAGAAILVPDKSPIHDLAGLKGRKIAVAKGSSANAHLLNALAKANFTFSDITPAYLQPADALAAFSNGSVDAWAIWDPYTALAQQRVHARILIDGTGGLQSGLGFQIASPAALANSGKVDAIRDFLARIAKARVWVKTHQHDWAAAWAKDANIPIEAAQIAVQRADQTEVPIDSALIAAEQHTADTFTRAKLIPGQISIAGIVDNRFNGTVTS